MDLANGIMKSLVYIASVQVACIGTVCAQNISMQLLYEPYPYDFPDKRNAETSALFPTPSCNGVTLEEATIDQLQDAMSTGRLTAVNLVDCYLERYFQVDDYIK